MSSRSKLHSSLFHPTLRKWQATDIEIAPHNLMFPIFIIDDDDCFKEIPSLPSIFWIGINKLKDYLEPYVNIGLCSVLVFGVVEKVPKDGNGSGADCIDNPVIRALPKLREWFPNLLIACDVCLCPYTDHGHCGIILDGELDNDVSIARLAEISLNYARAGAQIIAPSDMMDNRIGAIKRILLESKLDGKTSVLSYAVKFASSFYGPFRDAAKSAPSFGDRKCYQLPPGSKGLAARAAQRDVEEGADMIMVKPALAYLDIVKQTKEQYPHIPLFVYQVSGEYAMIYHGAANGAFNLETVLQEVLVSMRRAGADCIITYYTPVILQLLDKLKNQ